MILRPLVLLAAVLFCVLSSYSADGDKVVELINPDNGSTKKGNSGEKGRDYKIWKKKKMSGETDVDKNLIIEDESKSKDMSDEDFAENIVGPKEDPPLEGEPQPKRNKRSSMHSDYAHTVLSRKNSPLQFSRVESIHERKKRGVNTDPSKIWPLNIPYVIDDSYAAYVESVQILKRVLQRIEDNVCLTFHDETDNWDPGNPSWFTQNGYEINGFIYIKVGTGCSAYLGAGDSSRTTYPCYDFNIITHELQHCLGMPHVQESRLAKNYITVNVDNVQEEYTSTYEVNTDDFYESYFDAHATLLYGNMAFNRNKMATYTPIRYDIFRDIYDKSMEDIAWHDLNHVYQCNAKVCGNNQTDCGPGYFARFKGVCRCTCPQEYDPSTNCQQMKNGPHDPSIVSWPDMPITLFAGNSSSPCPDGFEEGTVTWASYTSVVQGYRTPQYYSVSGNTITLRMCSKTGPTPTPADWESWPPGGAVCTIRPKGATGCLQPFEETIYELAGYEITSSTGETAGIDPHSYNVTFHFCCKKTEKDTYPLDLPDGHQFRLLAARGTCPIIRGLYSYLARTDFKTSLTEETGDLSNFGPDVYIYSSLWRVYYCDYLPPFYGCNQEHTLDADNPSVTVTTPGYGQEGTDKNKRCFYVFNAPENHQLRLTINFVDFDSSYDFFNLKRYNKWQDPVPYKESEMFKQIVSESNYISVEFWTGAFYSKPPGINFTVDVILPTDMCYDVTNNGANYLGPTAFSETYERCLPWKDTLNCHDFPRDHLWLTESDNQCRNAGGDLYQPYCYYHVEGHNCIKGYCDACGQIDRRDVINNCASLIAADPDYCTNSVDRFGCYKTCGFTQESYTATNITCGQPTMPSDGEATEELMSSYALGDTVQVRCTVFNTTTPAVKTITCTQNGWTPLSHACNECPDPTWVPYGDLCFWHYSGAPVSRSVAYNDCASKGPGGSLFQIQDRNDSNVLVDYKFLKGIDYRGQVWLSCGLAQDGKWYFDDTTTEMTFFNWTSTAVIDDVNLSACRMNCLPMGDFGGWTAVDPDSADEKGQYACQVDKTATQSSCQDEYNLCNNLMASKPDFCQDSQTDYMKTTYCKESCGTCTQTASTTCSTPSSSTYSRVSANSTIAVGEYMSFDCNSGYYYISGDYDRACSKTGALLGDELVCSTTPVATTKGLNNVRFRQETLPAGRAVILDWDVDTIPFDGTITEWYYYCETAQTVDFIVFREQNGNYAHVGHNQMACEPGYRRRYLVPSANQITVQEGDVVAIYSLAGSSVYVSDCVGAKEEDFAFTSFTAASITAIESMSVAVNQSYCMMPSIGYRVVP